MIPQTTAISNIKLPILKKEEYDIWAMEMEHYLEMLKKERKAKNILLDGPSLKTHMRRFHGMEDYCKRRSGKLSEPRFGGQMYSKKMQKAVLNNLLYQLGSDQVLKYQQRCKIIKFLRSLPSAWSNLAITMRTNPKIDNLSIDDLYNNLRVFKQEIQGAPKPSSSAQISLQLLLLSTNQCSEKKKFLLVLRMKYLFLFAKQKEDLDLLHEDLELIDDG
ncbi:hypothetical protein Tco_0389400 [Tanacetum coccineum]